MNPASFLLQDLIKTPSKAEPVLDCLTAAELTSIQDTLERIKKKRKLVDRRSEKPVRQDAAATSIASALAAVVASALQPEPETKRVKSQPKSCSELTTNIIDGVEWLSFVYSHNRTLKRYSIRTDIASISLDVMDEQFKTDNCVYPRAKLPKETYQGNRWGYETECNELGWKLAWLNASDIAGKRGLIQRAVDSYRNRYPNMRSRRVARQEKLINGTLRKRKHREPKDEIPPCPSACETTPLSPTSLTLESATVKSAHHPKTLAIDDLTTHTRLRIKINVETVSLDQIPLDFCRRNCPFPRAMTSLSESTSGDRVRWVEETIFNQLAWKLAWLNQRLLADKRNLLQRALDVYRRKFMPGLQPRKNAPRTAPFALHTTAMAAIPIPPAVIAVPTATPLTTMALSEQNAQFAEQDWHDHVNSPAMSCVSGTTASLDFTDCFSLAEDDLSMTLDDPIPSPYATASRSTSPPCLEDHTTSSISSSGYNTPSPSHPTSGLFLSDIYESLAQPPVIHGELECSDPLASSHLSFSAVHQDLLVKMEEDIQEGFSGHYFDPLLF